MKKALIIIATIAATLISVKAEKYLQITASDGSSVRYHLSVNPKVTFTEESMVIKAGEDLIEYPLADYRKFHIYNDSGFNDVATDNSIHVEFRGEKILISQLCSGRHVAVYDIAGRLVSEGEANADGVVMLKLPRSGSAIYIIRSNNLSFKISR